MPAGLVVVYRRARVGAVYTVHAIARAGAVLGRRSGGSGSVGPLSKESCHYLFAAAADRHLFLISWILFNSIHVGHVPTNTNPPPALVTRAFLRNIHISSYRLIIFFRFRLSSSHSPLFFSLLPDLRRLSLPRLFFPPLPPSFLVSPHAPSLSHITVFVLRIHILFSVCSTYS